MIDKNKRILVLGGSGRIGTALLDLLDREKYNYYAPTRNVADFDSTIEVLSYLGNHHCSYIINLLGVTTTIGLNKDKPAEIAHNTLQMNLNVFNLCVCNKKLPDKVINIISSCAYGQADVLLEENFLKGHIHESIAPHGETKRMVYLLGKFYRDQFDLPVTNICFNNVAGAEHWDNPGTLKVMAAIVKKITDAKLAGAPEVVLMGTGVARREFIHVDDCAAGILAALNHDENFDLINIGTGKDLSIRDMADIVSSMVGYQGEIKWGGGENGQLKKIFNVDKMRDKLHFEPQKYPLVELIVKEYQSYLKAQP